MKMTLSKWENSSNKDRYDFLSNGEIKVKKIIGIDGSSLVGDDSKVITGFIVSVGIITLSDPQETRTLAMEQAEKSIGYWKAQSDIDNKVSI